MTSDKTLDEEELRRRLEQQLGVEAVHEAFAHRESLGLREALAICALLLLPELEGLRARHDVEVRFRHTRDAAKYNEEMQAVQAAHGCYGGRRG